jgi:4-cresol dehydrogenase (hydroxylating)
MRVPPNVSSADYMKALGEFEQAIGREWVFTTDADLDLYRDAFSPFLNEPEEKIASGALAPDSTQQVQQIVRIANKYRIPLYPISTGKNLGYGGSAPAYSGSVVLDLKRMNRILEVNEQHAFALVEPGVSYFDLYRYIHEHKLKVWIDCPDLVTKMGFWLMPEPEAYLRGTVSVPRYQDLMPLVETLNLVENSRITAGFPDLESPLLGYPPVGQVQLWNETGPPKLSAEHLNLMKGAKLGYSPELEAYGERTGLPYWRLWLSFHGPEEVIHAQWRAAQRHFARIPGAKFAVVDQLTLPVDAQQATKYHEPELAVPSLRAFSIGARTPWTPTPSKGHMWFSPIIPRTGEAIIEANRVFSEAAKSLGMPLFTTFTLPACFWERAFIFILATPVTEDPSTNKRYREGFKQLIEIGGQHGWGEYRTAPVFQHAVMDVYSFNNHALQRFHATLKDAIDPNGILSAGRYDIWPKHLRGKT